MVCRPLASGGMGTVYLGRLVGPAGFSRVVAIKRLHLSAGDAEVNKAVADAAMDEARLSARFRHPNVVPLLDVISAEREILLVFEYVHGETLGKLLRASSKVDRPLPISHAAAILAGALHGLHHAHEATSEHGQPLEIVHRDVSPQNLIVGVDGMVRVCDFGVAKATGRLQATTHGELKGKMAYMAPEQVLGKPIDRRADVFAAGIVLWESLTMRRLFLMEEEEAAATTLHRVLNERIPPPSEHRSEVPPALDAVVLRALARNPNDRFATAHDFAIALEAAVTPAPAHQVGQWTSEIAANALEIRADDVADVEALSVIAPSVVPAPAVPVVAPPAAKSRRVPFIIGAVVLALAMFGAGLGARQLGPTNAKVEPPAVSSPPVVPPAPAPSPAVITIPTVAFESTPPPEVSNHPVARKTPPPKRPPVCVPPYTYFDTHEKIDKVKPECRNVAH